MRHLNYNHLLYFWTVAREGSITRASEVLFLTPQTISGQLKLLEETIGQPLFHRVGRRLVLSETGQLVKEYADEIFSLGAELAQRMKNLDPGTPIALNVGVVNSIAKLISYQILAPGLEGDQGIRLTCWEGSLEHLLAELAIHRLDLVISDHPIPTGLSVRAYNHPLGESGVSFFAGASIAESYARDFPASLDHAPVLLPMNTSALRRRLDDWFEARGIRPRVIAEFDDSALLKAFGEAGLGLFPAPSVIAEQVATMYSASRIGEVDGVHETYFAISPERKIKHPAVRMITESARARLFS
ncbi:MAG: transcriptional activator NhaR [Gammaproteobacteria bacterium]|nr:transcriptional activator NhaR [Gammaproteobacteria bacterium]